MSLFTALTEARPLFKEALQAYKETLSESREPPEHAEHAEMAGLGELADSRTTIGLR